MTPIDQKLDAITEKLHAIDVTLACVQKDVASVQKDVARNTDDLEEHMAQTRLLKAEMNNRLSPVEDHIKMLGSWKTGAVVIGALVMWAVTMLKTLGAF